MATGTATTGRSPTSTTLTRPIQSDLDASGRAIRNSIDGEKQVLLDGRVQYVWRVQRYQAGLFLEIYNLTNHVNYATRRAAAPHRCSCSDEQRAIRERCKSVRG
jgi:hypothetical protein